LNAKEAIGIYLASSTFIKRGGGTNAFFFGASLPSWGKGVTKSIFYYESALTQLSSTPSHASAK
jgi:hypothetical protein